VILVVSVCPQRSNVSITEELLLWGHGYAEIEEGVFLWWNEFNKK